MSNPLISVIIPVYNAEKYLKRCLDSIVNQTYRKLEIILIDDESSDGSGMICDEYAACDSRVRVIHKKNGGASAARNQGISIANGEYIAFCDSDDWVIEGMYQSLYEAAEKTGADIAVGGFYVVNSDLSIDRPCCNVEKMIVLNNAEAMERLFTLDESICLDVAPWNKLYKTKLFEGLRFEEGRTCEDTLLSPFIFKAAKKTVQVPGIMYNYFMSENSVSRLKFSEKNLDYIYANKIPMEMIQSDYPQLSTLAFNRYLKALHIVTCYFFKCGGGKSSPYFESITQAYQAAKKENIQHDKVTDVYLKNIELIIKFPALFLFKEALVKFGVGIMKKNKQVMY